MTRARRFGLASLAALALYLGAFAPAAFAQTASLTGESLESSSVVGSGHDTSFTYTCNKGGETLVTFQTNGVALGPYTGTFTEMGWFTIGEQTNTTIDTRGVGAILDFQAEFTIVSEFPMATVSGTKTLAANAPQVPVLSGGLGRCDPDGSTSPSTSPGEVFAIVPPPFIEYQAQINAATGSRSDSGTGSVLLHSMPVLPATLNFQEVFNSSQPEPPGECEDVHENGEGHEDHGNGLGKGHLKHCIEE